MVLTVLTWANARSGGSFDCMADVLHDRFKDSGEPAQIGKAEYLAIVPGRTLPTEKTTLRYAKVAFDVTRAHARVSPVVVVSEWFKTALNFQLERTREGCQIS